MVEQPLREAVAARHAAVAAAGEEVHDVAARSRSGSKPPSARLPEVPAGAANSWSGIACASAANTASAMRWLTSAAQPDTGRG